MDLSCQGPAWVDENRPVQENSLDGLISRNGKINMDNFEIIYTNADGLPNRLNELKAFVNSNKNKPKVIAVTEVKHKNKWNLLKS